MTNAHMQAKPSTRNTQDMEAEGNMSVKKAQKHQLGLLRTQTYPRSCSSSRWYAWLLDRRTTLAHLLLFTQDSRVSQNGLYLFFMQRHRKRCKKLNVSLTILGVTYNVRQRCKLFFIST